MRSNQNSRIFYHIFYHIWEADNLFRSSPLSLRVCSLGLYNHNLRSNLFYGTSIPATILVFKKCREDDEDILFIDASKEFEKRKNQNYLTDENIEKIFDTYKNRKEVEKYSHKANLDEIKENEYNLNIPRYVDTFEEEEIIDIKEIAKNLKKLNKDEVGLQSKIAKFCDELGINKPF